MDADLQLLQSYAAVRDAEAFSAIIGRHQGLVYGTCLRILGNQADAEDAAQECFLRLARHAESIRSSLTGWLHTCATRVSISALRQAEVQRRREKAYAAAKAQPGREATWREIAPAVDRALEELPEGLRAVLVEHFLRQRRRADIARQLGISSAALSRRMSAGIVQLRRSLKRAGVVTSSAVLVGLLADNAAVAAPASLTCGLGKLALAGVGKSAAGSGAAAGLSGAKLAAIFTVAAALTAGGSMGAYWYLHATRPRQVQAPAAMPLHKAVEGAPAIAAAPPPQTQPAQARPAQPRVAKIGRMVWRLVPATDGNGPTPPPDWGITFRSVEPPNVAPPDANGPGPNRPGK